MTRTRMAAAALAALALAGCATPPSPPIATHTFVILTMSDDSEPTDKVALAALQAHPSWHPRYGDLRRGAVETIAQRLTHDPRGWHIAPAVDVSLLALVAAHHDDGSTFLDDQNVPRPEVAELLKRLDIDAVFVVTERTLAKGPIVVGQVEDSDGVLMGWEKVSVGYFDRTRPLGKEADLVSFSDRILEATTPDEHAAAMARDYEGSRRRLLEDLLQFQDH